uniref:Uncharacterized protein n=1 Tax=Lepeophtheirus salmonis TaxID=72036 RepID=A0A0K2V350_LEPSM
MPSDSVVIKQSGMSLKWRAYIIVRIDRISRSPAYKWN